MIKTNLDDDYKVYKVYNRRSTIPFVSFKNNGCGVKYMYINSYIMRHMGFPKYVNVSFDDEHNCLYFKASTNENDLRCSDNGTSCLGKNVVITPFMRYCNLNIDDYNGRYAAYISIDATANASWCVELYPKSK